MVSSSQDIPNLYHEIHNCIQNNNHSKILELSENILNQNADEKEAQQCKVLSLLKLNKHKQAVNYIERNDLHSSFLMEYAFALHEANHDLLKDTLTRISTMKRTTTFNPQEFKYWIIDTLSHTDPKKAEEMKQEVEYEVNINTNDIESIQELLQINFSRKRKENTGNTDNKNNSKKKKKPKKKRLPKNTEVKPDPERWVPRLQRKKYKNAMKNKMAYQGGASDNTTTSSTFKKK